MTRFKNRYVAVLLTVLMTVALAVSPTVAVAAKPSLPATVGLQLLAINDFHGQLPYYNSSLGGASVLSAYLDKFEAEAAEANGAETLRLGIGDLIGASPAVSGLLQDEPTMKVLDMMDFDYLTTGNHEFDEGIDELLRLQWGGWHPVTGFWEGTDAKFTVANVVYTATGGHIFRPFVVKKVGGIKVGLIGVVYQGTPSIVTASGVAGLTFLDEAETVNKYVGLLKKQGVEAIVVMMHNGGSGKADGSGPITGAIVPIIEAMDDEVDVVLTAHSHAEYWGIVDGKLVTQAYSAGRAVADVDLVLDRATGDVASKSARIVRTVRSPKPEWLVEDAAIAEYVADVTAFLAPVINRVVGVAATDITRSASPAGESALGNLIADAQAWKMGTPIAFMNPGGIRAEMLAGEVTWGELFAIQPFANNLVSMDLKGSDIELALEQQWMGGNASAPKVLQVHGISYTWDSAAPAGSRVDPANILVGGTPINLTATYRVTMNSFLADGGDNFAAFRNGTGKVVGGVDLDALVEYVGQLSQPFTSTIQGRIMVY